MFVKQFACWWMTLATLTLSSVASVNRPKLSPCASWPLEGTVIALETGTSPDNYSAFIDVNDTLYVADREKGSIQIWSEKNGNVTRTIFRNRAISIAFFVTSASDIYFDHAHEGVISTWSSTKKTTDNVAYINKGCTSLFMSVNQALYCSITSGHMVVKMFPKKSVPTFITAAGTGCPGSASSMLHGQLGIHVILKLDLYVADTENDRIQFYRAGQLNGTTVAVSFLLSKPTCILLDADDNLYIVDRQNSRIIRTGPRGSDCVIGCPTYEGSPIANRLFMPLVASFDSYGNVYVTSQSANGILKFPVSNDACTCFPPVITLFPSPSSSEIPLQIRRSQDFYVSAFVQLNCSDSSNVNTSWLILNCTLNCSVPATLNSLIELSPYEVFVAARGLTYGSYEMKFIATITNPPYLTSTLSAFVKINPTGITANLVQNGTSAVTSGQNQRLLLDPGSYSVNPDENSFNASDWTYAYQCRIFGASNRSSPLQIDAISHPCFSNRNARRLEWSSHPAVPVHSAVTILPGSLTQNRTYQFAVYMMNLRNFTARGAGFVLVSVEATERQMVAIVCVISTMCSPNQEYQYINPSTQVALHSDCVGGCPSLRRIEWRVYQGDNDTLTNTIKWKPFVKQNSSNSSYFYGTNTSDFTAVNNLFLHHAEISYWSFEVVYTFLQENSTSALNFIINQCPVNGSCSIDPSSGTTTTLFTVNCSGWIDQDPIKDYSLYSWKSSSSERMMIAFSTMLIFQVRLPVGDRNTSLLHLMVEIRDLLNCVAEFKMDPLVVTQNTQAMDEFIDSLDYSNVGNTKNVLVDLLTSGHPNTVSQVAMVVAQVLHTRNEENLENALNSGIPGATISISPLNSEGPTMSSNPSNQSNTDDYLRELNVLAQTRDFMIPCVTALLITTIDSIKLQANRLAEITESTHELTQKACLNASTKCLQLARALKARSQSVSFEDAHFAVNQLIRCINNVLTAVNVPVQERGYSLELDFRRANEVGQGSLSDEMAKERLRAYQKSTAAQISEQAREIFSLLTEVLDLHQNIGQKLTISSKTLIFSLETATVESLSRMRFEPLSRIQLCLPSSIDFGLPQNASVSVRSTMHTLAPAGRSQSETHTNMSTVMSLSIFNQRGEEVSLEVSDDQPIEFFIPRDPYLILRPMALQNATSKTIKEAFDYQLIDLDHLVGNTGLTVSVHFEIQPLNPNLAYAFVYRFDPTLQIDDLKTQIDGWSRFCPSSQLHTYFIDNRRTAGHRKLVFGLRELTEPEKQILCSNGPQKNLPNFRTPFNFSSDYRLRIYTSGCYYLDRDQNWRSDGVWVGPKTNHNRTQCFSTHLTTFTSSFFTLPLSESGTRLARNHTCASLWRPSSIGRCELIAYGHF